MFFILASLSYLLPVVYLFFRLKRNFILPEHKTSYSYILPAIGLYIPLSNIILNDTYGTLSNIAILTAEYLVVFLLYMFHLILLFDLFLIINRLGKFIPPGQFRKKKFKVWALPTAIAISVAVIIAGSIHFNTIRTSTHHVKIPQKEMAGEHLTVAFAADFHIQERVSLRFVEKFVDRIQNINPDLMLFGGDIVEGHSKQNGLGKFEKQLARINTKYGVYSSVGNHELYGGGDYRTFFRNAGIKLLTDTTELIAGSLNLTGRYDHHKQNRKTITTLMEEINNDLPVILIDHRPTDIPRISGTRVNIQLSGHTHHGQLFPFNFITKAIYPVSWGYKKIKNSHFFVTSGIRLWGPPVRTTGKSEIMVLRITFI